MQQLRKLVLEVIAKSQFEEIIPVYNDSSVLGTVGTAIGYQRVEREIMRVRDADGRTYTHFHSPPYEVGTRLETFEETSWWRRLFSGTYLEAEDTHERIPIKEPKILA